MYGHITSSSEMDQQNYLSVALLMVHREYPFPTTCMARSALTGS